MKKVSKILKLRRWLFWDSYNWGTYILGMKPPDNTAVNRAKSPIAPMYTVSTTGGDGDMETWLSKLINWFLNLFKPKQYAKAGSF